MDKKLAEKVRAYVDQLRARVPYLHEEHLLDWLERVELEAEENEDILSHHQYLQGVADGLDVLVSELIDEAQDVLANQNN